MAKIEVSSVFTALYTMNSEYEEIVHQVLVPSKSLSYLKHLFKKIVIYGHETPIAFSLIMSRVIKPSWNLSFHL